MTDHAEEQAMEAEALEAIFDTHFTALPKEENGRIHWAVEIYPEAASDPEELDELNHVAIKLHAILPETYPDEALPDLRVEIVKGLADDPHRIELQGLAEEEAAANEGIPSIYAIAERLREWLAENNRPGLADTSMHAQMMRKQREQEMQQKKAAQAFEAQTAQDEMTAAELEELAVRKRRAEGTPCNKENFQAWKTRFEEEMRQKEIEAAQEAANEGGDKKKKTSSTTGSSKPESRMTGFDFFSNKTNNYEALELAAEEAGKQEENNDEDEEALEDVDEELFDDDVDLDDMDFSDEDEDDDEDELDI